MGNTVIYDTAQIQAARGFAVRPPADRRRNILQPSHASGRAVTELTRRDAQGSSSRTPRATCSNRAVSEGIFDERAPSRLDQLRSASIENAVKIADEEPRMSPGSGPEVLLHP